MDALLLAEVNDLLLGKLRVVFDLVNSGHDSCMRQKLFQVLLAVLEENVSWVDGSKEKVDVVKAQGLQALVESQLDTGVVGSPCLGNDKDVLTLDTSLKGSLETSANLLFVSVAVGAVDQLVSVL
ncbi:hypothetical protein HG531_013036 [Fusarium graminearum]|nr:hypothetical protein HG531_013036 [Fusarium graminearum]